MYLLGPWIGKFGKGEIKVIPGHSIPLSQLIGIASVGIVAALNSFVIFYALKQAKELRVASRRR